MSSQPSLLSRLAFPFLAAISLLAGGALLTTMIPVDAASGLAFAGDRDDGDRDRGHRAAPEVIAARQKFFGIENVDDKGRVKKDKVIMSWATNTTYAVSVLGRVILLDSYINRPELPSAPLDLRRTPILPRDLADLRPEAIYIGHGHGDHADNAAFIAKWANATIYASPETCDVMQLDVQRMWNDPNLHNGGAKIVPNGDPVKCVGVVPRGSRPGEYDEATDRAQARRISPPGSSLCVLAFKFIHSGTAPVDPSGCDTRHTGGWPSTRTGPSPFGPGGSALHIPI